MKLRRAPWLIIICLAAIRVGSTENVQDAKTLMNAMRSRYEKSWYDTMTFTQKSTTYNPDGTNKVETWYEAGSLPGKLRIDFGPPSEGNGALFTGGKQILFEKGKETKNQPRLNILLVIGFDVYRQAPETTLAQLKQEGFDVTKFHEDVWKGEAVYVVGADKGDVKSKQLWIERKRLLFMRLIEPDSHDAKNVNDIRFEDYRQLQKAWISARVEVYSNEKLVFTEDYSDIQGDVKLPEAIFDPKEFRTAHWEK